MNRKDFIKALNDKKITDFEIIEDKSIQQLTVIVNCKAAKKFVEEYLYQNLRIGVSRKVLIKAKN